MIVVAGFEPATLGYKTENAVEYILTHMYLRIN